MRHPQSHIEVALDLAVFSLLSPHLIDDHRAKEAVVLLNTSCFYVVRVLEVSRLKVQAGTCCHQVYDDLDKTLLL